MSPRARLSRCLSGWLCILAIAAASQFAQWYKNDPRAMLDAEQMDLWIGLDFVLSPVYQMDQPGYPPRPWIRRLFGDRVPPLELVSPHPNAPYAPARGMALLPEETIERLKPYSTFYPADRIRSIEPFEVRVFRPSGGNLDVPLPGRTFRGLPKTFHNIGIQCNAPASPVYLASGLLTAFLGRGVTNFSLNAMDPVTASQLPNRLLGTAVCVLVFIFTLSITGSTAMGLAAGLFQALEPISLAESRTNKTDTSIAFFVLLTVALYWWTREHRRRERMSWSGVAFGLALLTKLQAILIPVVIIAWNVLQRLCARGYSRLRPIRAAALVLLPLVGAGAVAVIAKWGTVPERLRPRLGGNQGFAIHILGSLGFFAMVLIALLLPPQETRAAIAEVKQRLAKARSGLRDFKWLDGLRWFGDRDDLMAFGIGIAVFVIGYPNLWGDPVRGFLQHWFGFWGRVGAAPVRAWFFVTQTIYLPTYYYFVMIPVHAHPLYMLAMLIGAAWAIQTIRREPLIESRTARGLLLIVCWILGYFAMTGAGGAYKKMQIATSFYPWLSMFAGMGLVVSLRRIAKQWAGIAAPALILACMVPPVLSHAPYYHLYVTPLLGNPNRLSRIDWISGDAVTGWERVVDYLRAIGRDGAKVAAVGGGYNLSFFYPHTFNGDAMKPEDLARAGIDYVAIHIQDKQRWPWQPLIAYFADRPPVHTVTINGIDVIWIYDAAEPAAT